MKSKSKSALTDTFVPVKSKGGTLEYEGFLKIELTNKKTGEVEVIEGKNLVTNATKDLLESNPFGLGQFNVQSTTTGKYYQLPAHNLFGGILLFADQQEENIDNIRWSKDNPPIAWAGNRVNSGTCQKRGNPVIDETGPIDDGYQWVWEWGEDKANGSYSSVSLTHGETGNMDDTLLNRTDDSNKAYYLWEALYTNSKAVNGMRPPCANQNTTNAYYDENFVNYMITPHYIDRKNNLWYVLRVLSTTQIEVRVFKRNIDLIPLGQCNIRNKTDVIESKNYFQKEVEVQTYTLGTPLINNATAINSISPDGKGNLYIFTIPNNSNQVIITKIDLINKTISQKTNIYAGVKFYINLNSMEYTSPVRYSKDVIPFIGEHIYIPNYNDNTSMIKVSIDNEADITHITNDGSITAGIRMYRGALNDRESGIYLSLCDTVVGYGIFNDRLTKITGGGINNVICQAKLTDLLQVVSVTESNNVVHELAINTFYKATIQNQPLFTKTSDKAMKITYTLREKSSANA